MSKTVFDHLNEQVDSVVRGRRFIIAEIGKLKLSVEDLKEGIDNSGAKELSSTIGELKSFISQAVNTLGELKSSVSQLSLSIGSLNKSVENTYNIVRNINPNTVSGATQSNIPQNQSLSTPVSAPPTQFNAPAPQAISKPVASNTASVKTQISSPENQFDNVITAAKSNASCKELGVLIDNIRTNLSKANPLNPTLFELSMEAGRLKSLGDKTLESNGIQTLEQKIVKWKSKS